ncbi:hypothetical protein BCR33DRAFT_736184 [Rhizoclosmatium globosum]|uniref:Uncharacterized protein n=1 Tax=Rhizoclosmatium globosum TaxID=329046 RepID=A0A1Y2CK22_9FUNG|nr:hypothetical protein BCR33DRAFT_736184 [Rhizoclosmatium globosum]|eukprot:ORY47363.1 hypothetical protein BCR33DRAFT_736184 [Rhizoclosmatium globosum]
MDPMELSKLSASLKRQQLLLKNEFDPKEEDEEGESENGILEQLLGPRVSANCAETTALATSSSASVSNVQPPRVITASPVTATTTTVQLAYTLLGNQTSKQDRQLPTDMQWEANIMGDGKILNNVFWPTTTSPSDFIDPNFPVFENPETWAIVTYFGNNTNSEQFRYTFALPEVLCAPSSNDTNNEIFRYTFNLPEAVNSTCINERFICRTITTKDAHGNTVTISQKVAVLCTYIISGQSSTGVQELW